MDEIEVKILDIKRKKIESKLVSLGAKKIFDGEIYALFFDFENKVMRNFKKTVRLRKVGDKSFITYKKPKLKHDHVKIRKELEVEVSDFETTKSILESIGLHSWMSLKKHRTSYKLDNVRFEFDKHHGQYSFVPEFLEIEAESIDTIYKYVKLLGFSKVDCKPWTISDLAEHYSKKNN